MDWLPVKGLPIEYCNVGDDYIACYGWDALSGEDGVFLGKICMEDGRYWFSPCAGISFSAAQLATIVYKLSEINSQISE